MQTYIGLIVASVSLFIVLVSAWGLGKSSRDNDENGKIASGVFSAVSMVTFIITVLIAVKYPSLELYCKSK